MGSHNVCIAPGGVLVSRDNDAIYRKATRDLTQWIITGPPGTQRKIPVQIYDTGPGGSIRVPVAWFRMQRIRSTDTCRPTPVDMDFHGTLRTEQQAMVSKVMDVIRRDGAATMVVQTGGGKTVCALAMSQRLNVKTLVLVHKTFLMDQWVERIREFLPDVRVSTVNGKERDFSGDIVVAMFQTMYSQRIPIDGSIGLVVVDEAHHVAAKTFTNVMLRGSQKYTLGLSATPDRKDGLDIVPLTGYLIHMDSENAARVEERSRITVNIHKYSCDAYESQPPRSRTGDVNYTSMVSTLASLRERTAWLCSLLRDVTKPTLVLTHRRQHVKDIHDECSRLGMDVRMFVPGVKDVPESRVILSTYQYASEGFDRRDLECLVMATPIKATTQAIGRVCRNMQSSGHEPLIIDIQDQWSVFIASGSKRRREYAAQGYTVYVKSYRERRDETSRGSMFLKD